VVPTSPVEGGTRDGWRRWFRDPRAPVATPIIALARELDRLDDVSDERATALAREFVPIGDRLVLALDLAQLDKLLVDLGLAQNEEAVRPQLVSHHLGWASWP